MNPLLRKEIEEQWNELLRQLRCWETLMWMRHAESPVGSAYAESCKFCKGSGRAHFCINPKCDGEARHECLHPTQEEIRKLNSIHDEFLVMHNRNVLAIEQMEKQNPLTRLFGDLLGGRN